MVKWEHRADDYWEILPQLTTVKGSLTAVIWSTPRACCSQPGRPPSQPAVAMPPPSERQKKRARDEARAARWAHENAPQAPTPGGLELERLWPSAPSWSRAAAPQAAIE